VPISKTILGELLIFGLLGFFPQLALAEEAQPLKNEVIDKKMLNPEELKNCIFVTHNCELCWVEKHGNVLCSSVGIACQPTKWNCLNLDLESR